MTRDTITGAFAIVVGAGYFYLALQLRASALSDNVGPGGVPQVIAIALMLLGLSLVLQGTFRRSLPDLTGEALLEIREQLLRAAGLLAIGIGFLVLLPHLGYVVAVSLLIVAVAAYQGVKPSWRLAVIGICGALGLWLLFAWLLGIKMPAGFLALPR